MYLKDVYQIKLLILDDIKRHAKINVCKTPEEYIPNRFLVCGRKFDIRLYALTLFLQPSIICIYRGRFYRFSLRHFTMKNFGNRTFHLANITAQTHSTWIHIISALVTMNSLFSVASSIINNKRCYDILISDNLRP